MEWGLISLVKHKTTSTCRGLIVINRGMCDTKWVTTLHKSTINMYHTFIHPNTPWLHRSSYYGFDDGTALKIDGIYLLSSRLLSRPLLLFLVTFSQFPRGEGEIGLVAHARYSKCGRAGRWNWKILIGCHMKIIFLKDCISSTITSTRNNKWQTAERLSAMNREIF